MKKIVSSVLAGALALSLTACGGSAASSAAPAAASSAAASEAASSAAASEAADFTGDGYDASVDYAALAGTTLKIAASATPHAEILNDAVAPILEAAGITLQVDVFDDYIQPNNVVEEGEYYANYFQHTPYLDSFNEENGTHLVSVAAVHYEPYALYAGKTASIDELADGAQIAVTNDPSNEARALQLLAAAGLIELDPEAGLNATQLDITSNPKNLKIVEMEAAQLPRTLQDVDMAVINGNYAKEAGLSPAEDGLYVEAADSEFAQTYANIVAVAEENKDADLTKALVAAITSQAVKDYIAATYADGSVLCIY